MFIVAVVSVPKYDLGAVLLFASLPVLLVTALAIPAAPMIRRMLLASPFILFMAAGNLLLDRHPAFTFMSIVITGGMLSASVIVAKSMITILALLALFTCLPFHRFGAALSSLGVPEVFVTQLLLVYRYSSLLAEEAAMMQKARDIRSFGGRGRGLSVTASLIGSLLVRTNSRAGRIYMAMVARGFHARPAAKEPLLLTRRDIGIVTGMGLLFLAMHLYH